MAYLLRPWDREWFKRCRRSWDLGSRCRHNLEPVTPPWKVDVDRALRDALAVYYFPGMWEWDRAIVLPLAFQAFDKAMITQRSRYEDAVAPLTPVQLSDWDERSAAGRDLLDQYLQWAPAVDRFWPVRVETDFDVQVPDFREPGQDLVAGGQTIRYTGRVDLLVVDEHDAYWVVRHRLVESGFTDLDFLLLDDEQVAACWAWEIFYIGMRVAGTIHNEMHAGGDPPDPPSPVSRPRASHAFARARAAARQVDPQGEAPEDAAGESASPGHRRMYAQAASVPDRIVVEEGGGMFRRTRIPRRGAELEEMGRRVALEALDMVDSVLAVYPTPAVEHCSRCAYRPPCLAMNEGANADAVIAAVYRPRPEEEPEEGRLGGVTWSMNRGAAPPARWSRRD